MQDRFGSSILWAAALALAGFGIVAVLVAPSFAGSGSRAFNRTIDKYYDLSGVTRLHLIADSSDLHVASARNGTASGANSGDNLHLHGTLRSNDQSVLDGFTIAFTRNGSDATLTLREASSTSHASLDASFNIDASLNRELAVQDGSGDITIEGPERSASVSNGSGGIVIKRATGALRIDDGSGDVRVEGADAAVNAESSSGSVDVSDARTTLALTSSSGDVSASLTSAWHGDGVDLHTSSGDVELKVPAGIRASVDANTGSGSVHNDAGLPTGNSSPRFLLRTSSGDVTISKR